MSFGRRYDPRGRRQFRAGTVRIDISCDMVFLCLFHMHIALHLSREGNQLEEL